MRCREICKDRLGLYLVNGIKISNQGYVLAEERNFQAGVKALIQNQKGEVLLLLDSRQINKDWQAWDFPGGRMNHDEDFLQTLKRELYEETGITKFSNPEFVKVALSTHEITLENRIKVGLILLLYRVTIDENTQITLSDEHLEYRWVDRMELRKLLNNAHKYPKKFVEDL